MTAVGLLAAAALALTACSSSSTPAPDGGGSGGDASGVVATLTSQGISEDLANQMNDLYEQALEGDTTLNIYGLGAIPLEPAIQKFNETFPGVTAVGTQLNHPDTVARVTAEEQSGQVSVGVITAVAETMVLVKDYIQAYTPLDADNLTEHALDPGGYYAFGLTPYGTYASSDLDAEIPDTWKGLITGEFDGTIAALDPAVAGGLSNATLTFLLNAGAITEADVDKFATLDILPTPDSGTMTNAVGSGERDLAFVNSYGVFAAQKAAGGFDDLEFHFPMKDANIAQPMFPILPNNPPNPALSELFINYVLSVPGQELVAEAGYLPTLQGVDAGIFPAADDVPGLIPGLRTDELQEGYAKWSPVISAAFPS